MGKMMTVYVAFMLIKRGEAKLDQKITAGFSPHVSTLGFYLCDYIPSATPATSA